MGKKIKDRDIPAATARQIEDWCSRHGYHKSLHEPGLKALREARSSKDLFRALSILKGYPDTIPATRIGE
jgi:hypothetical protein